MHLTVFTTVSKLEFTLVDLRVVFFQPTSLHLIWSNFPLCKHVTATLAGPNRASICIWLYRDFVNNINMLYPTPAFCQMMELLTVRVPGFPNTLKFQSSRRLKHVEIRYCSLAAASTLLYCHLRNANGSLNGLFGACPRSSVGMSAHGEAQCRWFEEES